MIFSVDFLSRAVHKAPIVVRPHHHNCYELVWYAMGEGEVSTPYTTYPYISNSIVIIPPGTQHNEVNRKKSSNLFLGFQTTLPDIPTGLFQATPEIVTILKMMLNEKSNTQPFRDEILSLQLHQVILMLTRSTCHSPEGNDFSSIRSNIDHYIDENLTLPIRITDFAEMYNYSPDRFRHIFTEQVGMSPKQYIITKRLKKAHVLLTTTDKSITDIAYECGFYDVSQFSKIFKSVYTMSPTVFRSVTRSGTKTHLRNEKE